MEVIVILCLIGFALLVFFAWKGNTEAKNQQLERALEIDSRKQELLKAMLVDHKIMDPEARKEHLANIYMMAEHLRQIDPNFPDALWEGVKESYEREVLGDS